MKKRNQVPTLNDKLKAEISFKEFCPPRPAFVNFQPNEEIIYGNHLRTVVKELSSDDDRFYLIEIDVKERDKRGNYTGNLVKELRYCAWVNLYPLSSLKNESNFRENKSPFWLSFSNGDIDALWSKFVSAGIDLCPAYQREYVWDDNDKEKLIDSIFENASIGTFLFARRSFHETKELYEIVDGKQRLTTIFDFILGKFSYKGYFFRDLSLADRNCIFGKSVQFATFEDFTGNSDLDRKTLLKLFLFINKSGKTQNPEFLENIEKQLAAM